MTSSFFPFSRIQRNHPSQQGSGIRSSFGCLSRSLPRSTALISFAAIVLATLPAHATIYYWDTTSTGLWGTGANWSTTATSGGPTGVVPTQNDSAVFNQSSVNGNEVVQLASGTTIVGLTFANTGSTQLESSSATAQTLTLGSGGITVNAGAGAVTIGDAANTLNFALSQPSSTITLNGATSLTVVGLTNITNTSASNITLTVNGAGNTATLGGFALNSGNKAGRTVQVNGSGNIAVTGAVVDGGSTLSNFTYAGSGTLTLSGANTYSGVTTISSGMVQFAKEVSLYNGNASSWTASNISVAGTLAFNVGGAGEFTSSDITTLLTNLDGAVSGNGLRSGSVIGFDTTNAAGGAFTVSNSIKNSTGSGGGPIGIAKLGTNTLVLTGSNGASGRTIISGGTLQYGIKTALYGGTTASWTAANITTASGATLAVNVGGTGEFAASDVTTLLTGVSVANTGTTGLQAGSNIGFDTTNASSGTFTYSGTIADSTGASGGAIGVTKLGAGTLVLSGTSTYSGATTVNAGTLLISGNVTNSTSATVINSAVLGGTGSLVSSIDVKNGGAFSPGLSASGTFNSGALTLEAGATFQLGINTSTGTASLANVTGSLSLASGAILNVTDFGSNITMTLGTVFDIIDYSGAWNGGLFIYNGSVLNNGATFASGANDYQINYNGTAGPDSAVTLTTVQAVPEPAVMVLFVGGISMIFCWRRNRRSPCAARVE